MSLPVVHMFWHGPALSRLERLCMKSFIAQGHRVLLHCYEHPSGVPEGVEASDAGAILGREHLFWERKTRSVANFADWFRFKVLFERGGIWADTDVVCLKPLQYTAEEIYGWQDEDTINIAVLGLPARHPLAAWMVDCWENPDRVLPYDGSRTRRRKWRRRLLPGNSRPHLRFGEFGVQGFTQAARHLGYHERALPFWHFYPIHYQNWRSIFDTTLRENPGITQASTALHLWNEMARRAPGFDKDARFPADSLFEQLCVRFDAE